MAELRQQTQPAQKPQQVPTPSKMGDKPTDKPVKLMAPALARETPSAESDQMMKAHEWTPKENAGFERYKKVADAYSGLNDKQFDAEAMRVLRTKLPKNPTEEQLDEIMMPKLKSGTIKKALAFVNKDVK